MIQVTNPAQSFSEFLGVDNKRINEIIDITIDFFKSQTGNIVNEFDIYAQMLKVAQTEQEQAVVFFLIGTLHDQIQEAKMITRAMGAFTNFAKNVSDIMEPGAWDKKFPDALKKAMEK